MKKSQPVKKIYLGKIIFFAVILLALLTAVAYLSINSAKRDETLIKDI